MHPVYLWTLPMFHCNGLCFPWTITAQAGTHVCLRRVEAKAVYDAFADAGVTHLCGAPIVMSLLLNAPDTARRKFPQKVQMMTAASAPPATVLEGMDRLGIERSEEHTSELQSLMRSSYAVFCLKKKNNIHFTISFIY